MKQFRRDYKSTASLRQAAWADAHSSTANWMILNAVPTSKDVLEHFQLSQPIAILPAMIVHKQKEVYNFDTFFIKEYFTWLCVMLALGTVGIIIIVNIEKRYANAIQFDYWEVIWEFWLAPFGLCGPVLMEGFPRKTFALFWVLAFYLFMTSFAAEFSSNLTVTKLYDGVENFEDIYRQNLPFFWTNLVSNSNYKIVSDLKKNYRKLRRPEYLNFDQIEDEEGSYRKYKEMGQQLLADGQTLLCCKIELCSFYNASLFEELTMKEDWTVPLTFHYRFGDTNDNRILKSFNLFLESSRKTRLIEELVDEWFGLKQNVEGSDRGKIGAGDNSALKLGSAICMAMVIGGMGSGLAIFVSLFSFCRERFGIKCPDCDWSSTPRHYASKETEKTKEMT